MPTAGRRKEVTCDPSGREPEPAAPDERVRGPHPHPGWPMPLESNLPWMDIEVAQAYFDMWLL